LIEGIRQAIPHTTEVISNSGSVLGPLFSATGNILKGSERILDGGLLPTICIGALGLGLTLALFLLYFSKRQAIS